MTKECGFQSEKKISNHSSVTSMCSVGVTLVVILISLNLMKFEVQNK